MMMHDVLRQTGLTRKAIEYYISQELIIPHAQENGYRLFSEADLLRLKEIAAYRQLGVSVAEMKLIFSGNKNAVLRELLFRRSIARKKEERKTALLAQLACGAAVEDVLPEISAMKASETIAERLLLAFPGYLGQYISLHFSVFLSMPLESEHQMQSYETIVGWLESLPTLDLPDDLRTFLDDISASMEAEQIEEIHCAVMKASENPESYLAEHEDAIRTYIRMKDTEAYRASPAARLTQLLQSFQQHTGYMEVFIPAMEALSPDYAAYRRRLLSADAVLRRRLEETARK